MAIFDDLEAEQTRLEAILDALDSEQWAATSGAAGWSVADVVLHLAQSEEAVAASVAAASVPAAGPTGATLGTILADRPAEASMDEVAEQAVRAERAERAEGSAVLQRWKRASAASRAALRAADPSQPLPWVGAPLKPATLATTRMTEHWAHGLDITGPLGIEFPDTSRLRHVAWLAQRTLPYAFAGAGLPPAEVSCKLTEPDGTTEWWFGPADAGSAISGLAGAFCRVAVRRLDADRSGLRVTGPDAATALRLLRTYAA
jgi:uncharacterized protein (TIGR03084 family)